MATQEFTDDFNRGDEELGASANWVEATGDIEVVSNEAEDQGNLAQAIFQTQPSDADQYAQNVRKTLTNDAGLIVRCQSSSSDDDLYRLSSRSANGDIFIIRRVSGGNTIISSIVSFSHSVDDVLRFEVEGTGATVSLRGYVNDTEEVSVDDTHANRHTGNGYTGLAMFGAGQAIDDFAGGILADAASGPANLKTWDTITKANVKTANGIAIANIKTKDTIA